MVQCVQLPTLPPRTLRGSLMEEVSCPAWGEGLVLSPELKANRSCIHHTPFSYPFVLALFGAARYLSLSRRDAMFLE